jgi:hypothetical protein
VTINKAMLGVTLDYLKKETKKHMHNFLFNKKQERVIRMHLRVFLFANHYRLKIKKNRRHMIPEIMGVA